MGRFEKLKALKSAVSKLQKAAEAGEPIGRQTGVDSRSWQQLMDKAQELEELRKPAQAAVPEDRELLRKIAGAGAVPTSSDLISAPLQQLKDAYGSIRKPMVEATGKVGEWVADTVRPPVDLPEAAKQQERAIAGGITQMALDPANLLAPGLGAAVGAADMAALPEENNARFQQMQNRWK